VSQQPRSTAHPGAMFDDSTVARHYADGNWDAATVADHVRHQATNNPDGMAYRAPDADLTWAQYDALATRLAGAFVQLGLARGDLLGTLLPGGSLVHVVYLAAQQAGLVTLGMGPRSGEQDVARLLESTSCGWLLTCTVHRGQDTRDLMCRLKPAVAELGHHITVDLDAWGMIVKLDGVRRDLPGYAVAESLLAERALGPDELFFLNSTSGTTGLPKCVTATMNNRKYFSRLAADAGGLGDDETILSVLPSPYGFGLWSAHVTPARYGYTTVLCADFDPDEALRLVETERVTVLAAVTSQLVMMLNSPAFAERDLSTLRVVFTGGEPLQRERAAEFERRTGATILQFYGSNESGPLSVTRTADPQDNRLGTVGRPIAAQQVRLFDQDGTDVTATGGPGQCAAAGPGTTPGYYRDPHADEQLFRTDGWQLTGDLATLDEDGYLTITGRAAELIIRGGHNISAGQVETEVGTHPRVAQVAVIGVPDDVLGERVCAVLTTRDGQPLDVDELRDHLDTRGVSKHYWPEQVQLRQQLPLGIGGKLDKHQLRQELRG